MSLNQDRNDPLPWTRRIPHHRSVEHAETQVLRRALANGGVVTRAEAIAIGMNSRTIDRRLASGRLVAVGPGVMCLPGVLVNEISILRAATLALDAVASHESAGRLHRLEGLLTSRVSVSVPVRRSNRFEGVIVHQTTDLTGDQTTDIDGIPVTDIPRTIIDLAAILTPQSLATVTDQAIRMNLTTYEAVSQRLEALARQGKPGVTKLRKLLEPRLGGQFASDSTLETRLLRVLERGGLPLPLSQFRPPWLRHMNGRVDLAYVAQRVIVEGDSRKWHGTPEAFQADRRRDNLAQLAGWIILRFTWQDITDRPSYVVATVREALSTRS